MLKTMTRRVRLRLLGDGWHAYGGAELPEDREIVVTEAEAAAVLRERSMRHSVEVVEVFEDDADDDAAAAELGD